MEEYRTVVLGAGAAIVAIFVATLVWAVVRRRRRRRALLAPLPLIPFSANRTGSPPPPPRPYATPGRPPIDPANVPTPAYTPAVADTNGRDGMHSRFARPDAIHHPAPGPAPSPSGSLVPSGAPSEASAPDGALAQTAFPGDLASGSPVDGASVRYWRPADGTLQFLPGRLEVVAGRDAGQEIRFVRTPGPDGTRVTFGRAEGAPYRHIQLREPTVSRAHARMTLDTAPSSEGDSRPPSAQWRLENLSATNPVVVNGRALGSDGSDACWVALRDGDRIEMGEVVFRFHER